MAIDQWPARPLAVLESRQPLGLEAPPPLRDSVRVHADQGCDLPVGNPVGGQEHDAGSFDRPLGSGVGADSALQLGPFGAGDQQRRDRRHAELLVWRRAVSICQELTRGCTRNPQDNGALATQTRTSRRRCDGAFAQLRVPRRPTKTRHQLKTVRRTRSSAARAAWSAATDLDLTPAGG